MNFVTTTPLQLIYFDRKWKINHQSLEQLKKISKPLKILTICGPYRIGKSTLMNKIFGVNDGFHIGDQVDGDTKGFWIWAKEETDHVLCLVDTEGLSDVNNIENSMDLQILTLSMLISSFLIINISGTLDNQTLDACYASTQLMKEVLQEEVIKNSSNLLFLIRDLSLDFGSLENAQHYLETTLNEIEKFPKNVDDLNYKRIDERNKIKLEFNQIYEGKLTCRDLPQPVSNIEDVIKMKDHPELIKNEFTSKLNEVVVEIEKVIGVKKIYGKDNILVLNGENFGDSLESFVEGVNSIGNTLNIPCKFNFNKLYEQQISERHERFKHELNAPNHFKNCQISIPEKIKSSPNFPKHQTEFQTIFPTSINCFDVEETINKISNGISEDSKDHLRKLCKESYQQMIESLQTKMKSEFKKLNSNIQSSTGTAKLKMTSDIQSINIVLPQSINNLQKSSFSTLRNQLQNCINRNDNYSENFISSVLFSTMMKELIEFKNSFNSSTILQFEEMKDMYVLDMTETFSFFEEMNKGNTKEVLNLKFGKSNQLKLSKGNIDLLESQFDSMNDLLHGPKIYYYTGNPGVINGSTSSNHQPQIYHYLNGSRPTKDTVCVRNATILGSSGNFDLYVDNVTINGNVILSGNMSIGPFTLS